MHHDAVSRAVIRVASHDDIHAARKRAAYGFVIFSPEDYRVREGYFLKPLQVGGDFPEQIVLVADAPVVL
jgi:hypothetical protein